MPGPIMTAQEAKKRYGSKYRSIKQKGNEISLRNSTGKTQTVSKNTRVYHRGRGNFAIYSQHRDMMRSGKKRHVNHLPPKKRGTRVGYGKYRQTHDGSSN